MSKMGDLLVMEGFTNKFENPCKDCTKRHERCHAECKVYLDWSKLNTECREREFRQREAAFLMSDDKRRGRIKKFRKGKNRNNRGRR